MMIGSVLNQGFAPLPAAARHSGPPQDASAQRRALLWELGASFVGAGLSVALAGAALGTQPVLFALVAGAATIIGLGRYVEIMFRIAYLNLLPFRDHGLIRLASLARRVGGTGGVAALAVAAILAVAS